MDWLAQYFACGFGVDVWGQPLLRVGREGLGSVVAEESGAGARILGISERIVVTSFGTLREPM